LTAMTVLVLTRPDDGTAGGVVAELERRGVAVVRGDVGDFPLDVTMVASLAGHHGWSGSLSLSGQRVGLDDIQAIYYRRPTGFRLPDHLCEYLARCSPTMQRASGSSLSSCPGQ
jgi:MvdD pre-ATP grasp domain